MKTINLSSFGDMLVLYHEQAFKTVVSTLQLNALMGAGWIKSTLIPGIRPYPPVNLGVFRAGWLTQNFNDGALLYNAVPYAHKIVFGVKPSQVETGQVVIDALAEWAVQKGLAQKEDASWLAQKILQKHLRTGVFFDPQFRILKRVRAEYFNTRLVKSIRTALAKIR